MATKSTPLDINTLVSAGVISGIDVSPDGQQIVFSSSQGGRAKLYVQQVDDSSSRSQLETGSEACTQPRWSPVGEWIAYLQDVGGDENYQVWIINPITGQRRNLTNAIGKLHENISWSHDGTRVAYVSNREGQFGVYYSDVMTAEVHRVTDHPAVHHSPEFSHDGRRLTYASNRTNDRMNWDTFVTDLAAGEERKLTRHDGAADEMSYYAGQRPHWSPDDAQVLVSSSIRGNYDIMQISPLSGASRWLLDSGLDEFNAQWSPDGKRLAYVLNDGCDNVLHVRDLATNEDRVVSQTAGSTGVIGMRGKGPDYRWMPDGTSLIYGHSGGREPGGVWISDLSHNSLRQLYSAPLDGLARELLVEPQTIQYQSFDGLTIEALLYLPINSKSVQAAILMPHGGPTGQSSNIWSPLVQYITSLGYAVLAPNFRGSTGYGRDFQWLNRNDWGGGDLTDVIYGSNWLESQGIAAEFGIMGGSYGGFMTLSAITQYPDKWKVAASIYGIANLVTMYETARWDMKLFQERNIGTPQENPTFYFERSPLNHVDQITCPVLILQGERDARVTVVEAEQIKASLERSNKPFEYVVYPDEGHGFAKLSTRLDYIRRIGEFFLKHLPPD